MSNHAMTSRRLAHAQPAGPTRRSNGLRQRTLGSAVMLATLALAFAPIPATAAAGNPIVIDFDQTRLVLGWASLWVIAVLALLACDAGGRAMARQFGHVLVGPIRRTLTRWRTAAREVSAARPARAASPPQTTTGRIAASQIATVLAQTRAQHRDRVSPMAYLRADRQARRVSSRAMVSFSRVGKW